MSKSESSSPKVERVINTSRSARLLAPDVPERLSTRVLESETPEIVLESSSRLVPRLLNPTADEYVPPASVPRLADEYVAEPEIVRDLNPDSSRVTNTDLFGLLTKRQRDYQREERRRQIATLNTYKTLETYDLDGNMKIVYSSDSVNKTDPRRTVRSEHTIEVHCTIIRIPKDDRIPGKEFYGHITLVINRNLSDIQETYHYGMHKPNSHKQSFWADEITTRSGYLRDLKNDKILLTNEEDLKYMFPAHNSARTLLLQYYKWCIESCPDVKPVANPARRRDVLTFKDTTSW
jgi:hypothetical protein